MPRIIAIFFAAIAIILMIAAPPVISQFTRFPVLDRIASSWLVQRTSALDDAPLPASKQAALIVAASGVGAMIYCHQAYGHPTATGERLYKGLQAIFLPHEGKGTPTDQFSGKTLQMLHGSAAHGVWVQPVNSIRDDKGEVIDVEVAPTPMSDLAACQATDQALQEMFLAEGRLFSVVGAQDA